MMGLPLPLEEGSSYTQQLLKMTVGTAHMPKTLKRQFGEEHQTCLTQMDDQILSLYAKGYGQSHQELAQYHEPVYHCV